MKINKKISLVNRTLLTSKLNRFIVIHYVGAVSTAKNNADYFYDEYRGASAHYFVDENEIWQVVENYNAAWHVGAQYYYNECRNGNSIGIEMCCKIDENGNWYIPEEVVNKTVELTKELMARYDIPIENVVRHWDVTRKCCPEPWIRDESKWINFKKRLEDKKMTEEEAKKIIQEKCGFDDNTMFWLSRYVYHEPLFIKWAESYKK